MIFWWQAFAAAMAKKQAEEAKVVQDKKLKGPPIPFACIRRVANGTEGLCGHIIPIDEYAFGDAAHAVNHYSTSNFLRCCTDCAEMARTKGLVGGTPTGGHVASNYK